MKPMAKVKKYNQVLKSVSHQLQKPELSQSSNGHLNSVAMTT